MKAVNLYVLTRGKENSFAEAYKALSCGTESVKLHERQDLLCLITMLGRAGADVRDLDAFWYSYRIPHISKEFDLLKIEPGNQILNIELKSQDVGEEKIRKQLLQNRSYLKHLETPVISYTYVSEIDRLYRLTGEELTVSAGDTLLEQLRMFRGHEITEDLDHLFRPGVFLVSPLTQPEKLLRGEYFLTDQQEHFKTDILQEIDKKPYIYGITGEPGTGKTLLLYDLAISLCTRGKCCVIHGARLSEGHEYINGHCEGLDILSPKNLSREILSRYDYLFVDEMQRIYLDLSDLILSFMGEKPIVVSFDSDQILSVEEEKRAITNRVKMLSIYRPFDLTNSLRINKQVAIFYKTMFCLKEPLHRPFDFSHVDIVYAEDEEEADKILSLYTKDYGYRFLYCTCLSDTRKILERGVPTHQIIGQEFDRVITMVDEHFYYSKDGVLEAVPHENGIYDYVRMLYQNVTRTRERLCILVYHNPTIYEILLSLRNANDDK